MDERWWIVVDPKNGAVEYGWRGRGGYTLCHDHIKDAMCDEQLRPSAKNWLVREVTVSSMPRPTLCCYPDACQWDSGECKADVCPNAARWTHTRASHG
jgi:hypothetical protein